MCAGRQTITLIDPTPHLICIYFEAGSALNGIKATLILSSYLYPCNAHLPWSIPKCVLIISGPSPAVFQLSFSFSSIILTFEYIASFFNYTFSEMITSAQKSAEATPFLSDEIESAVEVHPLNLALYLHKENYKIVHQNRIFE